MMALDQKSHATSNLTWRRWATGANSREIVTPPLLSFFYGRTI